MNSFLKTIVVSIFLILLVAGCSAHVDLSDRPLKNGIVLSFKASASLNRVRGRSHALRAFVYQLSESKSFAKAASSEEGLRRLMVGNFQDPSAVSVSLLPPLLPGRKAVRRLDKVEGAKFVALVACYSFGISRKTTVRIFPLKFSKKKSGFMEIATVPVPLRVSVSLGTAGIVGSRAEDSEREKWKFEPLTNPEIKFQPLEIL